MKKLSLTTSKKIWLSVAILLVGYCVSMAFGSVLGRKNLLQVQRVANDWYPAANQIRQAASYFNGQIDLYNDALSLQDQEILALANNEAEKVQASLNTIVRSASFGTSQLDAITTLQTDLQNFSHQADGAYKEAIRVLHEGSGGERETTFQSQLVDFAQQGEELHDRLQLEARRFSDLLHTELLDVSSDLKHEQFLNIVVFLVVTIVALTCIQIILTRSTREIIDRDDALDRVVSGEVELGEAFFLLNSVSGKIIEDAESTAEQSLLCLALSQKMVEQVENIETSTQKLTANVRDLSGKTAWFLERIPGFGRAVKKANGSIQVIDRELREIRNLGLVLAELGAQLREVTHSSKLPQAEQLQLSAVRVGEFAEAILTRLNTIQQGIEGNVNLVSLVEKQSNELEGLVKAVKTTLDSQILETHHMSLLIEALRREDGSLNDSLTCINEQTLHLSEGGKLVRNEAQKLLFMVKQLHELVKTAKFKHQILHEHHVSPSKKSPDRMSE